MDLFAPRHVLIILVVLFMTTVCGAIYFAPTIVAFARNHKNKIPILLTNFFFGWSVIGWIICLIWSVASQKPDVIVISPSQPQSSSSQPPPQR